MNDLYETDILIWSEQQAEHLRRFAATERSNDAVIDWPNIIEEIESVGREQLHAVESLLFQALVHMLKARAWPTSLATSGWQGEARGFRAQARRRFAPSMRQRIDLIGIYADALHALPETVDGVPPLPVPAECPVTLDELLADG
ncbi:MAG TPA: DUF29 domain-containing protein [Stellaceae bacterium]|nr:DUF29 domain-containing protein [Stellaceae bacterium]